MVNFDQNESDRRVIQLRMDVDLLKKKNEQLFNKVLSLKGGLANSVIINPNTPVQTINRQTDSPNQTFPITEVPSGTIDGSNKVFTTSKAILALPKPVLSLNGVIQDPFNATVDYTFTKNRLVYTIAPELNAKHWILYWPTSGGVVGNARYFNASAGDRIDWGANAAHWNIGGDLTIAFWIKIPGNSSNSSTLGTIIFYGNASSGGNDSYKSFLSGSSGNWNIAAAHEDTLSNPDSVIIANGLKNDTWYFIAYVRDSVAKTYTGYIGDGSSISAGGSGSYIHTPAAPGSGQQLSVGVQYNSGIGSNLFLNATLEEYYIWSGKLNTTDLKSVMQGSLVLTNLQLACLTGNSPEIDLSQTGGSGTVTGTTIVQGHP